MPVTCSHGAKVTMYKFYVAEDGAPLRLHMDGNDMFSGAHFDEYIADYEYLKAGPVDQDVFRPPAICHGQEVQRLGRPPAFPLRMAALLPAVRIGAAPHLSPGKGLWILSLFYALVYKEAPC